MEANIVWFRRRGSKGLSRSENNSIQMYYINIVVTFLGLEDTVSKPVLKNCNYYFLFNITTIKYNTILFIAWYYIIAFVI